jgi:ubiquinone/menaquinone biosynthesis C-methylase UbiE
MYQLTERLHRLPLLLQEEFARMIRAAGFKAVHYEDLTMGVAAIHSGFKL